MTIFTDLFGQKEERERKDYLIYAVPKSTRFKIFHVIQENAFTYNPEYHFKTNDVYPDLHKLRSLIVKQLGLININNEPSHPQAVAEWIEKCSDNDFLRTIELFLYLKQEDRTFDFYKRLVNSIEQINTAFNNDRIGYEIIKVPSGNRIFRKDSEYLHEEAVKPALSSLHKHNFEGAYGEFENALSDYLKGDFEGTVQEANKAFESSMKAILDMLKISYKVDVDTAAPLIQKLKEKGFLAPHTTQIADKLEEMFKGLPNIRNKQGGHGAGMKARKVDRSTAQLALHLCASFIVFLIQRYEESTKK